MTKARQTAAHYPIRAVAKLTGLGIDTLRAWERRHRAVTPVRDDRGRIRGTLGDERVEAPAERGGPDGHATAPASVGAGGRRARSSAASAWYASAPLESGR